MATVTEVRTWAVAEGNATGRGKLRAEVIKQWNTDHPNDPYEPNAPRDGFTGNTPDYPDDDFDANFPDPPADPLGDTGETKPTRPRSTKAAPRGGGRGLFGRGGVRGLFGRGKKTGPKEKQPPRISTEDLLGAVWRGAAKMMPLPPVQRTLRMQSRVGGPIMDDVIRGTVIDPILQPLARIAAQGKTIQALAGPPMFVTAICVHQAQRAGMDPPQEPHPMFMAVAVEGLRSSLMAWMEVSGPKFEEAMQREAEFEEKYGKSVDAMIDLIFAAPATSPEESEAEEAAILRAQGIL